MNADHETTRRLRQRATELGFDLCGVAPAAAGLGEHRLRAWLAEERHGEMAYMERHLEARLDPNRVLDSVQSIVVVGLNYRTSKTAPADPGCGRISCYAQGADYHDVLRSKLTAFGQRFEELRPGVPWRAVVDSAPLMERDYAQLAGLGWFGKNTLLLNKKLGSFFFLGALLVGCSLDYDSTTSTSHCGTCTRCLEACPTDAFDGPYRLDPRRCISYLTIEHRSAIPEALREKMGNWIFGCDVCQEVCPWNRKAPESQVDEFTPRSAQLHVDLGELLGMEDEEFRRRYRGTPLFRTKRDRLVRNACIAAGNSGREEFLEPLKKLVESETAEIKEAAQWAISRFNRNGGPELR